jgi:ABC-type transporter Mla maintaining outer membrane lipid asymmetry permease subunit MlaE
MAPSRSAGHRQRRRGRFSLERPDRLASRRVWALALTGTSVLVMGVLMSLALAWSIALRFLDVSPGSHWRRGLRCW